MIYTTPETVPNLNGYTTRSGRSIRRVERYEPDEDTIFIDQDSDDSDYESENCSVSDVVLPIISDEEQDAGDDDEYESSSEEEIDSSDDESLSGTTVSSILGEDEEDIDALNWDTLTIDAKSSDDESDEEEEFDDDEEDAI